MSVLLAGWLFSFIRCPSLTWFPADTLTEEDCECTWRGLVGALFMSGPKSTTRPAKERLAGDHHSSGYLLVKITSRSVFIFLSFTIFDVWTFIWWSLVVILFWSYSGDLTLSCGAFNEGLVVKNPSYYYSLFEMSRNVHLSPHKRKPTRKCRQLFAKFLF